ncbi:hypothetical protein AFLA_007259 [Aspergillus flavus NRRL3357]|nr:hypothetical protein AFLA_007259 [Aspergillus flavus NRRL3357]
MNSDSHLMNAHVSMKPELIANHLGRRLSIPIVCSQWLTNQKWERERVPLDSSKFRSATHSRDPLRMEGTTFAPKYGVNRVGRSR